MGCGFLDGGWPLAFAHRGGAASARAAGVPENSLAAFGLAVAAGYRFVETDVHATADGVPVVVHDATLARVAGVRGRVGGEPVVPALGEVLEAFPAVRFNVDVKSWPAVGPAVEAVRAAGAQGRVLWASFSDARLAAVRAAAGADAVTSLGARSVGRLWAAARGCGGGSVRLPAAAVAAQVPVSYLAVPVAGRRFVEVAHRCGLQVHVWTVDDPAVMVRLLGWGVDGIMTDRLEVLRAVLQRRGLWW
ncbi:MAG TPA: glycerophosphodiester phosphodiesterase family protein [Pilimelia sp.]|nr:glycerophosphodiester phosphodiesterase family protein [Pilimelia sp.]